MRTSEGERGSERVRAPSSTSRGAITRRPEGKPGMLTSGIAGGLPSGRRVIGLRQVDEMALGPGRLVGANTEHLTRQPPTLSNT